ncbi:MAG: phenylalanine--tRNA ligase subunit beta [Chitinivibrionales bacterium]|nr:phenylalanine--tRNA ligase subunit beta [Chitinivibrionales bacterium]
MLIPLEWLKEFVDISVPVEQLADAITRAGLEVTAVSTVHIPDGVKVARITAVRPHPDADKLSLCDVDIGAKLTIVCGAPNVREGMLAPLATVGTQLASECRVKKAKIRGVESSGMLCSEKELGLSDDHSGIMTLPEEYAAGEELSKYYPDQPVIEIEITPDRGDCLSMLGVAREVSAVLSVPLKDTALRPEESGDKITDALKIEIKNAPACPRYLGRLISGVIIGESPSWLKHRLRSAGLRPINNVVDITNYILLHFGHPMHAFDYNRISGKKIIIDNARENQKFTTLDETERTLVADDLLIYDGEQAVALAGIMGGEGSAISGSTTDVFLECAYFDPVTIRKTSKRLGLSTDSSYRFERGVDPDRGLVNALDTAAELIRRCSGGTVATGMIDACPSPCKKRTVTLRPSRVTRLLGVEIGKQSLIEYLSSLGIQLVHDHGERLEFSIPLYRHDISSEVDCIEEAGRLYGYDNIPSADRAPVSLSVHPSRVEKTIDMINSTLAAMGFHEIITDGMTSEKIHAFMTPHKEPVRIMNPLNPDMALLRTTMLSGCLKTIAYNIHRKNSDSRLFEVGRTFEQKTGAQLPEERDMLAIILDGNFIPGAWNAHSLPGDFYVVKGIVDSLVRALGLAAPEYDSGASLPPYFDTTSSALRSTGCISGAVGTIKKEACALFDIHTDIYFAELDITGLLKTDRTLPEYKPLPRHPALERDFCFVMDESIQSKQIVSEIHALSPLIESVVPFDVYRGEKVGSGKKSIAYSISFRAPDRTLAEKEIEPLCRSCIASLKEKYGIELRV